MRFILAIVSLVLAVVLIGFGIAQRTVFAGPDRLTARSEVTSDAPVTVLDGETLNALPGLQDVRVAGDTIFAAYGRTTDILAWVGDTSFNRLSYDETTRELDNTVVTGEEATVPSPVDSDLWLKQYSAEGDLRMPIKLDPEYSVILVSDGTAPAPADVSITWPLDNRTPWAGPLVAGGAAMLLLALIFFVWGLLHQRRARGPRRTSIKPSRGARMPRLPRQRSYRVRKPKAVTAKGRRSTRRMIAVVPVTLAGLLVLSGCSSDFWPRADDLPAASASPSASEDTAADPTPAAATVTQVRSIVANVADVAAAADAALDGEALKARFTGPALDLRLANYAVRAKDSAYAAPVAIPTDEIQVTLPQITGENWPRSLFTVVRSTSDATAAPVALTLVQETARDPYRVEYAVGLEPDHVLPPLAPEGVGALPLGPDSPVLSLPPGQLAAAYLDVINNGEASASAALFDIAKDTLLPQLTATRDSVKAAVPATASVEFANAVGTADVISLSSNEAGALVNVYLTESTTVKPVEAGATVNPEGAVKTLSGVTATGKGVTADYGDQLLFYIPPLGSTDKIELLGFTQGLISAKELP